MLEALDAESKAHFEALCAHLASAGIEYHVEPRLVRGLGLLHAHGVRMDHRCARSQSTVCAGGRYDGLIAQLGGASTPGIGWAMGQERIVMLLEKQGLAAAPTRPHVYLVLVGERTEIAGFKLAEQLRDAWPALAAADQPGRRQFQDAIQARRQERRAVRARFGG